MDEHLTVKCLIEQLVSGSENAWSYFLKKYGGLIIYSINRVINKYNYRATQDDIEDCFQDILRILLEDNYRRLKGIRYFEEKPFNSWLCTVSVRHTENYFGRRKLLAQLPEEIMNMLPSKSLPPDVESFRRQIIEIINKLPNHKMRLVLLYILDGLSLNDTAHLMDVNISTVKELKAKGISEITKHISD